MNDNTRHVLLVEDEIELASLVSDYLKQAGLRVSLCHRGDQALAQFKHLQPDLLVLDLMLPGLDGLSICKEVRQFSAVPIIMVTARVEEVDRLLGLELGADDYLCKPFSPRELVARVKAICRRMEPGFGKTGSNERLQLDTERFMARLDGKMLNLTPVEFRLLHHLVSHAGKVFSRSQLLDHVHDDSRVVTDRTVDSHIKNLRKKLRDAARKDDEWIHSIYGLGYKFEWP
ncbi:response regulator [Permianibacter aggregans]|uniref:Two-component system response regulator BaeR n=2 Tax=Permianibacter aggregans TaxID=1510150 RepID=A0A4R6UMT2_9GAMM|nr:response regulator [Permianibacter aggregans]TDQ44534.1 two-component system response regulator BaeR [Permianibacter aggregans]